MSDVEEGIITWINEAWLGRFIQDTNWMFTYLETLHFVGVCLLFGSIFFVDIRLMGFLRRIPIAAALSFLPITIAAFVLLLVTGIGFVSTNPGSYWDNPAFKLKLFFIMLGGINAVVFTALEHRKVLTLGMHDDTDRFTKVAAGLSLSFWVMVLLLGRALPLFDTGQG